MRIDVTNKEVAILQYAYLILGDRDVHVESRGDIVSLVF